MASFALFVTKSPYDSRNPESALAFCLAALAQGHEIKHVFFYQSGVHNASALLQGPSDEVSMKENWQALNKEHNIPLYVCVTASSRRGVLSPEDCLQDMQSNLANGFELVGMSEYFAALHESELKSIQF